MINEEKLYATLNSIIDGQVFSESNEQLGPLENMFSALEAVQNSHIRQCACTALALLEVRKLAPDGLNSLISAEVRRFIDSCVIDFDRNLRVSLSENCRENGLDDILDPNAELREEILSDS